MLFFFCFGFGHEYEIDTHVAGDVAKYLTGIAFSVALVLLCLEMVCCDNGITLW